MKKFCILFVLLFIIILTVCVSAVPKAQSAPEFLRVHIRADSNDADDQSVKYEVKDAVVRFLMPVAATCNTKEEAMDKIADILRDIEAVADGVLAARGYGYTCRAKLKREEFPTRVYDGVTLESGVYDALILELGTGTGANWWCVIYPPLCFAGEATGANIRYRSAIYDIIAGFFSRTTGASA